ncbi:MULTISPECIES: HesB/IscA family protein [Halomonadaceae]|jgi:iron-sulfur cluster assembly protein|uniref:Iron-sulfur cluster assembly protein n=1 Tax=Onishia taeanensis TaxID=284577 RepID=A0A1G7SLK6_9GAMM|nr:MULTISPECIES: iron-sulfur cluster assembly accessory protein [Halomonas]MAX31882.1 iron-sulfur cluster assembly accessory protein [Halomonadaceae bacterium]MDI4638578.1 iron-sulfur cluster assembly accessory protein [Halomonas sp. BMC7]NUJ59564.1 iron-sulfur cluster assembly accessory protein [Halomonas taeanensis]RAR60943.1 iron-sulfur cluster assembly protein [Halomonas taeanensis]SDG23967.1 iron-sulfur cluster assembly protein [Halomonas taeanensis]|tara:strand:+ start:7758 stop:8084 length:327 start_codon:yes stop_codon:yes gene_type:complete
MAHLSITPAAASQIRQVLDERGHGLGLRVSVKPSGCSGYSYVLDFADETGGDDVTFEEHGVAVYVAPEALDMLDGSEVDYVSEGLNRFFRFNNPNVKDQCGCGESFTV